MLVPAHSSMSDIRVGAAPALSSVIAVLENAEKDVEKDMLNAPKLTHELGVDLERSLAFYAGVIGFRVLFSRQRIGSSIWSSRGLHPSPSR